MSDDTQFCSFCGKPKADAGLLIAGPGALFICDECTVMCAESVVAQHIANLNEALRVLASAAKPTPPAEAA